MSNVLFVCVQNAGRSQMAEALYERFGGTARSAGTQPAERVHPEVVIVMREVGVELEGRTPQRLTGELAQGAAMLITMGCGESCPVVPGVRREDWPLDDPKGRPLDEVRRIRDAIRARVEALIEREGVGRSR